MKIIGLTGPTGAGKSTVMTIAKKLNIKIIDCDKIAREVTKKGEPALLKLSEHFGEDIIENGELNRAVLAKKAFSTKEETTALNRIIFPFILKNLSAKITEEIEAGTHSLLLDAPTLYESGADVLCDKVIAILSSSDSRFKRILKRDGISLSDAKRRMAAGKPDSFYAKADYIIKNDGTMKEFLNNIETVLTQILGGK